MSQALVVPMVAHVVLATILYVFLTFARAPSVWGIGRRRDNGGSWDEIESRISANLSNQFEWPVFFHIACLLLLLVEVSYSSVILAWVFVVGRVLHSAIQILTVNVRVRGLVFTINFLAVIGLWFAVLMAY